MDDMYAIRGEAIERSKLRPRPDVDDDTAGRRRRRLVEELDAVGDGLVVVRVQRVQVRAARPLRRVAAASTVVVVVDGGGGEGDRRWPRREGEEADEHLPESVHDPGRPPRLGLAVMRMRCFPPKALCLKPRHE
uniref:DUF834 domain-containing protein n=1 Tax=Oryza barthii TaxID=65489 RepID=A0A0D3FRZ7_9ORYZ